MKKVTKAVPDTYRAIARLAVISPDLVSLQLITPKVIELQRRLPIAMCEILEAQARDEAYCILKNLSDMSLKFQLSYFDSALAKEINCSLIPI